MKPKWRRKPKLIADHRKRLDPTTQVIKTAPNGTILLQQITWRPAKATTCRNCKIAFYAFLIDAKRGRGTFCSGSCAQEWLHKQRRLR